MKKFKGKYRIASARLLNYDYGRQGAYFITICTKNRRHYFGEIENAEMHLSDLGKCAQREWIKSAEMRPNMKLELGAFVVMPDHFHAVIIIGANDHNTILPSSEAAWDGDMASNADGYGLHGCATDAMDDDGAGLDDDGATDAMHRVSVRNSHPNPNPDPHPAITAAWAAIDAANKRNYPKSKNKFGPQSNNLASIVRGFKSAVTTYARKNNSDFAWQPRFHDSIIRDYAGFERIQRYIQNNTANWK